jgi:hypothetical protein
VLITVDLSSTLCLNVLAMNLIPAVEEVDTLHSMIIRQIEICTI